MANTIHRTPAGISIYRSDWIEPDNTRIPGGTLAKNGRSIAHLDLFELSHLAAEIERLINHLHPTQKEAS
ncbi:hypothetical protein [Galactobacter sp.]|uniref:hypothetical protein n=1 Tax=Galactobacter sp. TaxID=2676125 RepID=UPI0025B8CF7D|nr:hypothetical protein [Galactobacter sp.]